MAFVSDDAVALESGTYGLLGLAIEDKGESAGPIILEEIYDAYYVWAA
jgi:hypothetical protein